MTAAAFHVMYVQNRSILSRMTIICVYAFDFIDSVPANSVDAFLLEALIYQILITTHNALSLKDSTVSN